LVLEEVEERGLEVEVEVLARAEAPEIWSEVGFLPTVSALVVGS
jgi:hypothetical protein